MNIFGALWGVGVRAFSMGGYAAGTWVAASPVDCGKAVALANGWVSAAVCRDLALAEAAGIAGLTVLLVGWTFVLRTWFWREAVSDMGNVSEKIAVHGLSRAIGLRDRSRVVRNEAILLGLVVIATVAGQAVSTGQDIVALMTGAPESFGPHAMLMSAAGCLIAIAVVLRPVFDVVTPAARWLNRRVFASARSGH